MLFVISSARNKSRTVQLEGTDPTSVLFTRPALRDTQETLHEAIMTALPIRTPPNCTAYTPPRFECTKCAKSYVQEVYFKRHVLSCAHKYDELPLKPNQKLKLYVKPKEQEEDVDGKHEI